MIKSIVSLMDENHVMLKNVVIERGEIADIDNIVKIWLDVIKWHAKIDDSFYLAPDGLDTFRTMLLNSLNDPQQAIFVAKHNGVTVGFIYGYIKRHGGFFKKRCVAHVSDIAVIPPLRNKKIGTKLLEHFEEHFAKKNEAEEITLYVHSKNLQAINFYEKHGFKERLIMMVKKVEY